MKKRLPSKSSDRTAQSVSIAPVVKDSIRSEGAARRWPGGIAGMIRAILEYTFYYADKGDRDKILDAVWRHR